MSKDITVKFSISGDLKSLGNDFSKLAKKFNQLEISANYLNSKLDSLSSKLKMVYQNAGNTKNLQGIDRLSNKLKNLGETSQGLKNLANNMSQVNKELGKTEKVSKKGAKKAKKQPGSFDKFLEGAGSQVPMLQNLGASVTNPYIMAGVAAAQAGEMVYTTIKDGVVAAMAFNGQMRELKNLNVGKSEKELASLNDQILGLSISKGLDPESAIKGFTQIQKATGKFGKEVGLIVGDVGQFSMAVGANQDALMESVGRAMNIYKFSGAGVEKYLTSQAKSAQLGVVSFDELAEAQNVYANSAASAGQSYNTANKFFTAFNKVSHDSEKSAAMTQSVFDGLANPKVKKGLTDLGIGLTDSEGKMLDATQIMGQMNEKFKGLSDTKFSEFMLKVGGSEDLKSAFTTIRGEGDALQKTFKEFDNSEISFDQMLQQGKSDPAVMKQIVGNQLKGLEVSLGQVFLPIVAKSLQFISEKIAWIYELFGGLNEQGSTFSGFMQTALTVGETLFNVLTFAYQAQAKMVQKFMEFASRSELVKDAVWLIGEAFEWIGTRVNNIIDFISSAIDPMMEKLELMESIYLKLTGRDEIVKQQRADEKMKDNVKLLLGNDNYEKLNSDPELFKAMVNQFGIKDKAGLVKLIAGGKGKEIKAAIENYGNPVIPGATGSNPLADSGLGGDVKSINEGGKSVRNVNVTIQKLVETINNNVSGVAEGMRKSEDIVLEGLVRIVNDAELALANSNTY